jgi:hypothetical protein
MTGRWNLEDRPNLIAHSRCLVSTHLPILDEALVSGAQSKALSLVHLDSDYKVRLQRL